MATLIVSTPSNAAISTDVITAPVINGVATFTVEVKPQPPNKPTKPNTTSRTEAWLERVRALPRANNLEKSVEMCFDAIEEAKESLVSLKQAAHLFTFMMDPSSGLLAVAYSDMSSARVVPSKTLRALGSDAKERAQTVDKALNLVLVNARKEPSKAMKRLLRVPSHVRSLVALRFFSLGGDSAPCAAENLQIGLETVLDDDVMVACNGEPSDRDDCVDQCSMAMEVLGDMPDNSVFLEALSAALNNKRVPESCTEVFDEFGDDCVCPDLDWLFKLDTPGSDDEDGEDDEDEE
jgi:hypothetical protein